MSKDRKRKLIISRFYIYALLISLFLFLPSYSHCASKDTSSEPPLSKDYVIGAGDVLEISVYEEEDLYKIVRVSGDGSISYPLLGRVEVGGLTVKQVEDKITALLSKDYLVNPQVTIFIREYSHFSVFGEVKKEGRYPLRGNLTVLEAITLAGGLTKIADPTHVKIIRTENGEEKTIYVNLKKITKGGDRSEDILVKPNDVIVVPESFL
jgi:polysaccharide export outer membrane protein